MGKIIVTHINMDLDAASSVCLEVIKGNTAIDLVELIPADCKERLPSTRYAVDHQLGVKGKGSALKELEKAEQILGKDFVAEVEAADTGDIKFQPRYSLGKLFNAMKSGVRASGGGEMDLLRVWLIFCKGVAEQQKEERRVEKEFINIKTVSIGSYRFAIPGEPLSPQAGIKLNEEGVTGSIYQDGLGLGVFRFPGRTEPVLSETCSELEKFEWFIHPAGFLACW